MPGQPSDPCPDAKSAFRPLHPALGPRSASRQPLPRREGAEEGVTPTQGPARILMQPGFSTERSIMVPALTAPALQTFPLFG